MDQNQDSTSEDRTAEVHNHRLSLVALSWLDGLEAMFIQGLR